MRIETGQTVLLYGAGGHAAVVADALLRANAATVLLATDDAPSKWGASLVGDWLCLPPVELAAALQQGFIHIAIGQNTLRRQLAERLGLFEDRERWLTVVHPAATVSGFAQLEAGVFVAANAVVAARSQVGRGAILNHACVVDHDVRIDEFAHVAPGAVLGGGVHIGAGCLVGAGAVVLPGLRIAAGTTIGAGAVVTGFISQAGVWTGVPAKLRKN